MTSKQKYVDLNNWAFQACEAVDKVFKNFSDEDLLNINQMVCEDRDAAHGSIPVAVALMKAVIDDEFLVRNIKAPQ